MLCSRASQETLEAYQCCEVLTNVWGPADSPLTGIKTRSSPVIQLGLRQPVMWSWSQLWFSRLFLVLRLVFQSFGFGLLVVVFLVIKLVLVKPCVYQSLSCVESMNDEHWPVISWLLLLHHHYFHSWTSPYYASSDFSTSRLCICAFGFWTSKSWSWNSKSWSWSLNTWVLRTSVWCWFWLLGRAQDPVVGRTTNHSTSDRSKDAQASRLWMVAKGIHCLFQGCDVVWFQNMISQQYYGFLCTYKKWMNSL